MVQHNYMSGLDRLDRCAARPARRQKTALLKRNAAKGRFEASGKKPNAEERRQKARLFFDGGKQELDQGPEKLENQNRNPGEHLDRAGEGKEGDQSKAHDNGQNHQRADDCGVVAAETGGRYRAYIR